MHSETLTPEVAVADSPAIQIPQQTAQVKVKKLPVIEMFGPTIAGEGNIIGQQTFFLRMGLCDYRCSMCDSMHAVDPSSVKLYAQWQTEDEIFQALEGLRKPNQTRWLSISGGNPCIHNLDNLVKNLKNVGWRINVETQGTFAPKWLLAVDNLTVSPKGPGMGIQTVTEDLDVFIDKVAFAVPLCIKIVVFDQRDLEFAIEVADRYTKRNNLRLDNFFLSLGNPMPPDKHGSWSIYVDDPNDSASLQHAEEVQQRILLEAYRRLFEDIKDHPLLSQMRFLPQWHVFAFGNRKGT